jgi:dienelactone hydrolase
VRLAIALVLVPHLAHADCPGAIVTREDGVIVNVDWPTRNATELRGRAITNSTLLTEYRLELRSDGSVASADTTTRMLDGKPATDHRDVATGAVYWSDRMPSTLEQVVMRAHGATTSVPIVATSKDVPAKAQVDRVDATDFTVTIGPRTYDVVVDARGCMTAATLASYGITFERREVDADDYPLEGRYAAPRGAPYTAADVKIPAPKGRVLGGTLTLPKAAGRVPAVVMITGISKHERNEGNPPFTPFRDIADVLGRAGIAVLRVDDRGVGESTGDFDKATSFDEADDVRTELAWLRTHPRVDPKRVGLVGHSEGGFIALVVAAGDPSLAAIAVLAGSGVPGEQLVTWQTIQTVNHDPAVPPDKRDAEIKKQLADRHDWTARDRAFVASDPADYAKRVKVPSLILQGGSDLHVPPRSAERLAATMRAAGNHDVTVRIIPHISHTLCPDIVGSLQAWSWLPSRRLSNTLLESLTSWLAGELKLTSRPS